MEARTQQPREQPADDQLTLGADIEESGAKREGDGE